jgi:hypothetical protein
MVGVLLVGLPLETRYTFSRLFRGTGWSGRPLMLQQGGVFDWIDRTVGTAPAVTMLPFPQNPGDYFSSSQYWEDVEFWNKSVVRGAYLAPGVYDTATGHSFPKLYLRFASRTGRASMSPTAYAAQSDRETRFRIRGVAVSVTRDVDLILAGSHWHADWLSFGLFDDGWTRPGKTATIRVFSSPVQRGPVTRRLAIGVAAGPRADRRPFTITSDLGRWRSVATNTPGSSGNGSTRFAYVDVCVPPGGFGDLHLLVLGRSPIPGDMANLATFSTPREGGAFVKQIALADEITPGCKRIR